MNLDKKYNLIFKSKIDIDWIITNSIHNHPCLYLIFKIQASNWDFPCLCKQRIWKTTF